MPGISETFRDACYSDNVSEVRELLRVHPELKSQINEPIFHFDSPAIVWAAGRNDRELAAALLDAGADLNARSRWWAGGFGALDSCTPEMAAYLIDRGAALDVHSAARLGMLDQLKEFVSAAPERVHARGGDGQTPLHFAATVEIADYLLDHGAEIDAIDVDHESTAAQYLVGSRPEVVRRLVERGCRTDILMAAALGGRELVQKHLDADASSIRTRVNGQYFPMRNAHAGGTIYIWVLGKSRSAHQIARKFGHDDLLSLLREHSPADVRLADAVDRGDEAEAAALVAEGAPRNPQQLAIAAEDNDAKAVRLMLQYGWSADPGEGATTPLHWAGWHGNAEMALAVLSHHPPLERLDPVHRATPLGWAIYGSEHGWHRKTGDYAATVETLLAAGAAHPGKIEGAEAVREVLRRGRS